NEYEQQRYPGDGFHSRLGAFLGTQGPVFEYQHYLAATLSRDNWNVRAQHRHKSSYGDCNSACGIAAEYHNEVDAYGLVDLAGTWRFNDRLAMTLHVLNVLDTDPPFTNNARQGSALSANIDTRYTDPRGRSVGVTLRGNFE
ncbi:MAG: TonB-dependent receptor, partial [Rhodospirillaceae bacterium]|nr:TonB-dependent receptor [Rhodospirillaceae bacterium]